MWLLQEIENSWHIIPTDDWIVHRPDEFCSCKPTKKVDKYEVWSHHSYDGREIVERKHKHTGN